MSSCLERFATNVNPCKAWEINPINDSAYNSKKDEKCDPSVYNLGQDFSPMISGQLTKLTDDLNGKNRCSNEIGSNDNH